MSKQSIPTILIDARMVGAIPHGIARYVTFLAKGLAHQKQAQGLSYQPVFLTTPETPAFYFAPFETLTLKTRFLDPRELFEIPALLKKLKPTLYHSPSFSSLWNCPCPSIVTVHDLNHLSFGKWSQRLYYWTLLRRFVRKSLAVITVSEFSRNEISHWLKIPSQKIDIVYNSIESNSAQPRSSSDPQSLVILEKLGIESGKYFFCLSNSKSHKNLKLLIQAYELFRKQQQNAWPLLLTIDPFSSSSTVRGIGPQSESDVSVLLAHSGGTLSPSLYEGFGLPPVEAAIGGAPLAVSKIPPHLEGLLDLEPHEVLWVEPRDLHGWVNAFHQLMRSEITSPSPKSRQKILERFSFMKMGHTMNQIYIRSLRDCSHLS